MIAALFVLAALAAPTMAAAQVEPGPTDGLVLPDRSVTTQNNASSLETNPAGLGFLESAEFRYTTDLGGDFDREVRDQHGAFLGAGTKFIAAGAAIQWLDRPIDGRQPTNYQKYSLGLALRPTESFSVGLGTHLFGSPTNRQLDGTLSVDVGTQWRLSRHVGFGLALRDVNQPFVSGGRGQPLRILPGAAVRLLGDRVEVDAAAEWTVADDALDLRPRVRIAPTDGLDLFARAAIPVAGPDAGPEGPEIVFSGGLGLSMAHVGLDAAARYRGGASDAEAFGGYTQSFWFSSRRRDSLFAPPGRWVRVDLDGGIAERAVSGPFVSNRRSFMDILLGLEEVSRSNSVEGVVLVVGQTGLGWGQAWELRRAIDRLRDRGKKVVAYLNRGSFKATYLASGADRIALLPSDPFEPEGLTSSTITYGDALARVGINAEFVRIGKYKSSPERFIRSKPSAPALEQTEAYVDAIFDGAVEAIAAGRDLSAQKVRQAIDTIPLLPDEAVDEGFVDGVAYPEELETTLRRKLGATSIQSLEEFQNRRDEQWPGGPKIAVVYIDGSIIQGQSGRTPLIDELLTGSETIGRVLDRLADDPQVRAVVIRVDSPGGSAIASDLIFRDIRRLAQQKPVVTSMGDVAASGGYYVAAGADQIFATPNTLTGSIGIYAGKFSLKRLFDSLGVHHTEIRRGKRADQFDIFEPWSDEQKARIARSIHYMYRLFLQQVAQTRPLTPAEIDAVGRGRIWAGEAARSRKLVDHRGGLLDAIRRAEDLAGLPPGRATYKAYPKTRSPLSIPTGGLNLAERLLGNSDDRTRPRRELGRTLQRLLGRFADALVLPLTYEPGEVLMLPPRPLPLQD